MSQPQVTLLIRVGSDIFLHLYWVACLYSCPAVARRLCGQVPGFSFLVTLHCMASCLRQHIGGVCRLSSTGHAITSCLPLAWKCPRRAIDAFRTNWLQIRFVVTARKLPAEEGEVLFNKEKIIAPFLCSCPLQTQLFPFSLQRNGIDFSNIDRHLDFSIIFPLACLPLILFFLFTKRVVYFWINTMDASRLSRNVETLGMGSNFEIQAIEETIICQHKGG